MVDDVILNKVATIEHCIHRIQAEYDGAREEFLTNFTKQDSIILNLQRACEAMIDLGMRIVRIKTLGLPQTAREVFLLLEQNKVIAPLLSQHLQAMVGFRNIAVHDYQKLNLDIVQSVIEKHLNDFLAFTKIALSL